MKTIISLLKMPKMLWIHLILASILGIISHLSIILISVIVAYVVVINNNVNYTHFLITIISLGVIRAICRYVEQACNHYVAFKLLASIRHDVFKKLRSLAPSKLDDKKSGELLTLISSDVELLEVFFAHTITPVIIAVSVSAIVFSFVSTINFNLAIILLVAYIILGVIVPFITYYLGKENSIINRKYMDRLTNNFYDVINGFEQLINMNNFGYFKDKIIKRSDALSLTDGKIFMQSNVITALTSIVITGCVIAGLSIIEPTDDKMIFVALVAMFFGFGPINALAQLGSGLTNPLASAKRIVGLLEESSQVKYEGDKVIAQSNVELKDVNFGYTNNLVVKDINFKLDKQTRLALIGENGKGKSTILKLLLRYYDVNSGSINYDNTNIKEYSEESIHQRVCMLDQYPFFFKASVKENMLVVKPQATDEEINQALKKAHVYDVINQCSEKLDTVLYKNKFSSGEMQRLALARIFLYDPDIYLLDEPIANLDALTAGLILSSIDNIDKDKSLIMISHRKNAYSICNKEYHI